VTNVLNAQAGLILAFFMAGEISAGPCLIGVTAAGHDFESPKRRDEIDRYSRTSGMLEHMGVLDGYLVGSVTRICVPVMIEACQNPPIDCPWSSLVKLGNPVCKLVVSFYNAKVFMKINRTCDSSWRV